MVNNSDFLSCKMAQGLGDVPAQVGDHMNPEELGLPCCAADHPGVALSRSLATQTLSFLTVGHLGGNSASVHLTFRVKV